MSYPQDLHAAGWVLSAIEDLASRLPLTTAEAFLELAQEAIDRAEHVVWERAAGEWHWREAEREARRGR